MVEKVKTYGLTILVAVGILVAVLLPGSDVPSVQIPYMDKVVHAGMFGTLTLCYVWEFCKAYHKYPNFLWSAVTLIGYGLLTELLQQLSPGRSCDLLDLAADSVGIFIILGIAWYRYKHQ